ncbi:MAG: hypothetical protein GEU98_07910 [Pseudonocardiaceae bacterium]|nr:hypothetical protein [Pseudonocardiaceae bacterium]
MDLVRHLEEAEFLALKTEAWGHDDVVIARELIPDLVKVIHSVLMQHEGTWRGNCRFCLKPAPCPTVQSIHHIVKDPQRQFVKLLDAADEP